MTLPGWTKLTSIDENGVDPLGLDRVHDRLSEWLTPGITQVTPRARYYAFYLWAIQATNELDHPRDRNAFIEGLRRREAAYVLANFADGDARDIVPAQLTGWEQGIQRWDKGQDDGLFSTKFSPLPSNRLGGFGQYYGGSLYKLGLWHIPADANGIERLTSAGKEIADTFARSIAQTAYYRQHQRDVTLVTKTLLEYGENAGLDRLTRKRSERQALLDLFLARGNHALPGAEWRRQSLLLILDVARAAEQAEYPFGWDRFDDALFDDAIYYRSFDGGERSTGYSPPEPLVECCERFRLYQANRYFIFALENVLWDLLAALQKESSGMRIDEYIDAINWQQVQRVFLAYAGSPALRGANLAGWLSTVYKGGNLISATGSRVFDLAARNVETGSEYGAGFALWESGPSETVGLALVVLLSLFCRWFHYRAENNGAWIDVVLHSKGDLWLEDIMATIETHLQQGAEVREFLKYVLTTWIVHQHDRVLLQKNKPGAGRLAQNQDQRLLFKKSYEPNWRGSRLQNATLILRDTGLIEIADNAVKLTREGKNRLAKELAEER